MYEITRQRRFNKSGFILAGLLLLLLVGGFYGCQLLQPKANPAELSDQMPLYRRIGILKSLGGIRTSNSGTHILQLDNGDNILLKSIQINMDDPAYLGKMVELRGILNYTTDNKQLMEVMNIDLVSEDASAGMTEVSWKELQNEEMDLVIKYKDDLKVESRSNELIFSREITPVTKRDIAGTEADNANDTVSADSEFTAVTEDVSSKSLADIIVHKMAISRFSLGEDETVYSVAGIEKGDADMLSSGVSRSRVGADSYEALKKVTADSVFYYIVAGNYVYKIVLTTGSDEETLSDQNLFYEMLGTMKLGADVAKIDDNDAENNSTQAEAVEADKAEAEVADEEEKSPTEEKTSTDEPITEVQKVEAVVESSPVEPVDLDGFEKLESESFKFSMQYPKSWYYSGSAGTDQNVIRHYEFGSQPLEEVPGNVSMDLMSGSIPTGSTSTVNGKDITVVSTATGVEVYVKGSGSRIYRFGGPSSNKGTLINMAASITD